MTNTVAVCSVNFNPVLHGCGLSSRLRRRVNCVCGSLRRAPAAGHEMAVLASIVALPATGRRAALFRVPSVRFPSSSLSPRAPIRCNAGSAQNDDDQQQQPSSSGFGTEFVEKSGSAIVADSRAKRDFQRLREHLQARRKSFWRDFKEQHVVYRRDRDRWGLGLSPIFTVYEDEAGNRYQVDVNNDEVLRRSGVDPYFTQFADEESKKLAEEKLELAKAHARDIQLGLVNPSPLSIVYEYKRANASSISSLGTGWWPGSSITLPAGAPWQFLSILIPLLSFALLGFGANWLFSRRRQNEDPTVNEKNMQMQMRKLSAQMRLVSSRETIDNIPPSQAVNGENAVANGAVTPGESGVQNSKEVLGEIVEAGQSRVNVDEFQRKVVEIQAMARNARLQEQESAEARSAQSFEKKKFLEMEMFEQIRVKRTENLAKDLDDVRRSGAENSEGPDLMPNSVKVFEEKRNIQAVDKGQFSTSKSVSEGSDNNSSKQLGLNSRPLRFKPNSPKSAGMMPRIILSAEEARARIASKRVRSNSPSPSSSSKPEFRSSNVGLGNNDLGKVQPSAVETPTSTNSTELERSVNATNLSAKESSKVLESGALDTSSYSGGTPAAGVPSDCQPEASSMSSTENINDSITLTKEPLSNSEKLNLDQQERPKDRAAEERAELKSEDEEEEKEWMRDDVLREIVFKVQANEEAGREPFYNLNSDQETLFFKGLERKFAREGDEVKKWIKDRVENIDYGSSGISVYDPPESYELKWKEGVDRSPKSELIDRFTQDRQKIINEKSGLIYTSPPDSESSTDSTEESRSPSSPAPSTLSSTAPPLPVSSSRTPPPLSKDLGTTHGRSREKLSGDSKTNVVISSSPRGGEATGPSPSTSPGTRTGKENWDHTKKWAKDLERKYAMETDPATRALMREMGQDLERWITEDEIEDARRMLDNGVEGEEEYVKMHYERTKGKIKRQREIFGRDAMLNKYSEYKEEAEEVELWWLALPFVVCIGLRSTAEEDVQMGLYSVDVTPALDGVTGLSSVPFRTVAFQDRGDAQNFCTLINSQPEKLSVDGAEPVPFDPKELYKDAKAEGFKVTVIKKGQLKLSVDESFDEVESRILQLGSAKYFEEMLSDRMIDMDSVVDDGLGFGRGPQ